MIRAFCLIAVSAAWLTSACTVPVHEDYPKYLKNNYKPAVFPKIADSAQYYLDPATEAHRYNVRSARAGFFLSTWEVEFGQIMDSTMKSAEVRSAFRSVKKVTSPYKADGLLLTFDLKRYEFRGFEARVALRIAAREDGRQLLSKTYVAKGRSQGGKIFWGGSLAMKNAVQQSTKSAVDKILTEFVLDLNKAVEVARLDSPDETAPPTDDEKGIGRELDEMEKEAREKAHTAPIDETITWNDPESNSSGSVTPRRDGTSSSGEYCREYQSTVTIDGRTQETYGTACRQPDGDWRIVD